MTQCPSTKKCPLCSQRPASPPGRIPHDQTPPTITFAKRTCGRIGRSTTVVTPTSCGHVRPKPTVGYQLADRTLLILSTTSRSS